MDKQSDCDRIKVLLKGPPTVYIIEQPVELISIGVSTSTCTKNNLAKTTSYGGY